MSERSSIVVPGISLPEWLLERELENVGRVFPDVNERLRMVIELACENVRRKTGGPFGAAVFERDSRKLFAVAVNLVVPSGQSFAHAEMAVIARTHFLTGTRNLDQFEIVSSCEPCVMCTGNILWSGIRSLVYGASEADAFEIGFDEGDKNREWADGFRRRGISVHGPMLPADSVRPFQLYREMDGPIY
ncbi:MAG: nucleoside deaminase [Planctomycetia bacterium]|nr:nucleoside deaminase [Planctomycetia bacterium]